MQVSHANKVLAEVKAIDVQIANLKAERDSRTAALSRMVGHKSGKVSLDTGSFTVSENNTYDENVMRDNLLPGQIRRCTVPKLDKATVKRLYPGVYSMARKTNGVKVTVG